MPCPNCEGNGCHYCQDGTVWITQCPLEILDDDIWEFIKYAELYEKGLPPIAGGALDQAKNFTDLASFYLGEKQYWKDTLRKQ